ncbi:MAG: marine proteobacterial sortase target protein, partial [Deltaproteobacteria bacterium]
GGFPSQKAAVIARTVLTLVLAAVAWGLGPWSLATTAVAATAEATATVGLGDVNDGTLLLRTKSPGAYLVAPRVGTWVEVEVNGVVAQTSVVQRFYNPSDMWVEGIYVFPLPESAAVDELYMLVGDRLIEGHIEKRKQARKTYAKARKQGKAAALVEQHRPNLFMGSVANIPPGGDVLVEIGFRQQIDYEDGQFSLRFPMVVAPRYEAGNPQGAVGKQARQINQSLGMPRGKGGTDGVEIEVRLNTGFSTAWVKSPSHKLDIQEEGDGSQLVRLSRGSVPANRDFVLKWAPKTGDLPMSALFKEKVGDSFYQLIMVIPPKPGQKNRLEIPREAIFVIDVSGSMSGPPLEQAKKAVIAALGKLKPVDSFNIVAFESVATAMSPVALPATEGALRRARAFVSALQSSGGTNMMSALELALDGNPSPGRLRQVVFVTDGGVSGQDTLFRFIRDNLSDSRLFTVGIGSAPNSYFMKKASQYGRGSYVYIASIKEVAPSMERLFSKLASPALTDVTIEFPESAEAQMWPARVPDLYSGEPIMVAVRTSTPLEEAIVVAGLRGKRTWSDEIYPAEARDGEGVGILWARAKLDSLQDAIRRAEDEDALGALRNEATEVALEHGMVSPFTSLVAVDVTPSRPPAEALHSRMVPLKPPAGGRYTRYFKATLLPKTAWGAELTDMLEGTAGPAGKQSARGMALAGLPQTATPAAFMFAVGLVTFMAALSLSLLAWRRV